MWTGLLDLPLPRYGFNFILCRVNQMKDVIRFTLKLINWGSNFPYRTGSLPQACTWSKLIYYITRGQYNSYNLGANHVNGDSTKSMRKFVTMKIEYSECWLRTWLRKPEVFSVYISCSSFFGPDHEYKINQMTVKNSHRFIYPHWQDNEVFVRAASSNCNFHNFVAIFYLCQLSSPATSGFLKLFRYTSEGSCKRTWSKYVWEK